MDCGRQGNRCIPWLQRITGCPLGGKGPSPSSKKNGSDSPLARQQFLIAVASALLAGITTMPLSAAETQQTTLPESAPAAEDPIVTNRLSHHPHMADQVFVFGRDGDLPWSLGEATRVIETVDAFGEAAIVLDDDRDRFPRNGTWVTTETLTAFPFTELVPSWMVETPPETGLTFDFRVRDIATGEWSPWLYLGQWGRTLHWPARTLRFDGGRVNTDYIILDNPADAFQARVRFGSYDIPTKAKPILSQLMVTTSGIIEDDALRSGLRLPKAPSGNAWVRDIPVPFHAQRNNGPEIGGSTCSPTSVKMVMEYQGVDLPTVDVCMGIWDNEYGIFGNWSRATAFASTHGLEARLVRIREWDQLKGYIAQGQPVIASIRFEEGTFPSNPSRQTNGHLIVIRGLTPEGDAIVNDPAHLERGNGIVYKAEELSNAWIKRGGVAYIIGPKRKPSASIGG
jgi:hypothetical protein